jgi:hemoglobin
LSQAVAGCRASPDIERMVSPDSAQRRANFAEAVTRETGLDEAMIERLIHGFYADVRADPLLAPIFATKITDWAPHLERMCDFWSSVMLMSGRYHGQPMAKHAPLPIEAVHFDRWLALFEAAARRLCPPPAASAFIERAKRIGESLELALAAERGQLLAPGDRLRAADAI